VLFYVKIHVKLPQLFTILCEYSRNVCSAKFHIWRENSRYNCIAFNRAIHDGEVLQVSDVKDGIAMNACYDRAAVDEVKQYFSDEAWEAVSEIMASINTLT